MLPFSVLTESTSALLQSFAGWTPVTPQATYPDCQTDSDSDAVSVEGHANPGAGAGGGTDLTAIPLLLEEEDQEAFFAQFSYHSYSQHVTGLNNPTGERQIEFTRKKLLEFAKAIFNLANANANVELIKDAIPEEHLPTVEKIVHIMFQDKWNADLEKDFLAKKVNVMDLDFNEKDGADVYCADGADVNSDAAVHEGQGQGAGAFSGTTHEQLVSSFQHTEGVNPAGAHQDPWLDVD